jgi:hypothetical protein
MNTLAIAKKFRQKVSEKIYIESEGKNCFLVFTPFQFDDGDHLRIVMKQEGRKWFLTDEGHTLMHLSYDEINLGSPKRAEIMESVLASHSVNRENGELRIDIKGDDHGDALYSFVQALIKISDISFTSKKRVESLFFDEFTEFFEEIVPEERRVFDYHDAKHDPEKKYIVDCKTNGVQKPLFVFGVNNDAKCRDVTITCMQFERFGVSFDSLAVFENQETMNRRVLARFSDVIGKQYSSLYGNKDRIQKHISRYLGLKSQTES